MASPAAHAERERYGPGKLWIAPLGTVTSTYTPTVAASLFTQGTTATGVPGATTFLPLGRTNEGMELSYSIETEDDTPAESFDPHRTIMTGRTASLAVSLRQINLTNLRAAFNLMGSTITAPTATAFSRVSPPSPGSESYCQIMWESDANDMIIIMYKTLQVGEFSLAGRKGAESMRLELEFRGNQPDSSVATVPVDILVAGVTYAETVSGD